MCLWTLQQDKSFFQSSESPLYSILSKELGISDEQTSRILEHRQRVKQLIHKLQESLKLIKDLKTSIDRKHGCLDTRCRAVQDSSMPKQVANFLIWITKNSGKLVKHVPNFLRTAIHTPCADFVADEDKPTVWVAIAHQYYFASNFHFGFSFVSQIERQQFQFCSYLHRICTNR